MRVLSGIQPSGALHLGNYFGMMKPILDLQEQGAESFVFIADYHALTTVDDPDRLRGHIRDAVLDFLALGLDPERTAFYVQSDLPEVTELTWLLSVVTPMGLLERCHSFKDKTAKGIPATHALFAYPVLMTADILAVRGEQVPVGQDQKQHLEVARDVAQKFNRQYGEVFVPPVPVIREQVATVPGLDGQKMSKSYGNTLDLFADPRATRKRIMKIVTDSRTVEEPKDPETCTVFQLYRLLVSDAEREAMAARYRAGGLGYGEAKKALADAFETHFAPFRERREALAADPDGVAAILAAGAERARAETRRTLDAARRAVGLA